MEAIAKILVLLLLIVLESYQLPSFGRKTETAANSDDRWNVTKTNSLAHKCTTPQPRAFSAKKLLEERKVALACRKVLPNDVVIHICDPGAGCCTEANSECGMRESEETQLVVKVMNMYFGPNSSCSTNIAPHPEYVPITVTNHTKCGCNYRKS